MITRRKRIQEISERIGRRRLVYFGTRGTDSRPLLEFEQFSDCICLVAPLSALSMPNECCLETLTGVRVDLDTYHTDVDKSDEARVLHQALLRACDAPCVLVTYRTAEFLTSVYFPRMDVTQYLGIFDGLAGMLEHKPFVETSLRKQNVPVVDWQYFADEDMARLGELIDVRPHVLRVNRSSGGRGLTLARTSRDLHRILPAHCDRFLGASPFLDPNIPLNVGACVFPDGSVVCHAPSLQLIGLGPCTTREFGYCGNDWGRIRDLDVAVLDALEEMTARVGRWLCGMGYVGAFGVDAILHEGQLYLSEVNPRFQGSSAVSAQIDRDLDIPDIYADHMAAFFGLSSPQGIPLRRLAREQPTVSQVVCYNCYGEEITRSRREATNRKSALVDLLPAQGIRTAQQGIAFKLVLRGPVTDDGHALSAASCRMLNSYGERCFLHSPCAGANL